MSNDEHKGVSGVQSKGVPKDNNGQKGISNERPKELGGHNDIEVKVGKDILTENLKRQGGVLGDVGKQKGVIGDFDEQESSQWDSSVDDEENVQGRRGSEVSLEDNDSDDRGRSQVSSMDNESRIRADTAESEGTFEGNEGRIRRRRSTGISDGLSEVISEHPEDELDESGDSFGSEDTYDDQEKVNNNNIVKEPVLIKANVLHHQNTSVLESIPSPTKEQAVLKRPHDTVMDNTRIAQTTKSGSPGGNTGITGDAQKEEDDLLEAYKARQEEMLEQERRMEEELARKEQERLDEMRLQLEQKQEEARKMAELERQRKEKEAAMQREREEYENEMKRKQLERRKAEEEQKRKEIERLEELKRREDESKER